MLNIPFAINLVVQNWSTLKFRKIFLKLKICCQKLQYQYAYELDAKKMFPILPISLELLSPIQTKLKILLSIQIQLIKNYLWKGFIWVSGATTDWSVSNLIPKKSEKFEFVKILLPRF